MGEIPNECLLEIVKERIENSEFDGLYNEDICCGCTLLDLMACGEPSAGCQLGYNDPEKAARDGSTVWVGPNKPVVAKHVVFNAQECPIAVCKGGPLVEAVRDGRPGWRCTQCGSWFTWPIFMEAGYVRGKRAQTVLDVLQERGQVKPGAARDLALVLQDAGITPQDLGIAFDAVQLAEAKVRVRAEVSEQDLAPIVICGFPGVGKTYASEKHGWQDADPNKFCWKLEEPGPFERKVRNPDFPANYIEHIRQQTGVVMCDTHTEVRDALVEANIPFFLVYPSEHLKDGYIKRYRDQGGPGLFLGLLAEKWDEWMADMDNETRHNGLIVLGDGEFLDSAALHFPGMPRRVVNEPDLLKLKDYRDESPRFEETVGMAAANAEPIKQAEVVQQPKPEDLRMPQSKADQLEGRRKIKGGD